MLYIYILNCYIYWTVLKIRWCVHNNCVDIVLRRNMSILHSWFWSVCLTLTKRKIGALFTNLLYFWSVCFKITGRYWKNDSSLLTRVTHSRQSLHYPLGRYDALFSEESASENQEKIVDKC